MKKLSGFLYSIFFTSAVIFFLCNIIALPNRLFKNDEATYSEVELYEQKTTISPANTTKLESSKNILNTTVDAVSKRISAQKTVNAAKKTTTSSSKARVFDYSKLSYTNVGVGNVTLKTPNYGVAQYRFCSGCKPFLYAHNKAGLFKSLADVKRGDIIKVKVDGKVVQYRVVNNFTFNVSVLNANTTAASSLRASLYKSTYGGIYDITLQTCAGKNDTLRRYIQAVKI